MLPTDEEKTKILEAQMANPDLPLASAEQFLITLASINELIPRLKLWLFQLDYQNLEKEVAEPLLDLKLGMDKLKKSETFKNILGALLAVGNFLNGVEAKGFLIEFLTKVPEVKDTVNKQSLMHHICEMMQEKFPQSTDLYSEIGEISRCAKIDFDDLKTNLDKMEKDCKESWDHLKAIAKHDATDMKTKQVSSQFIRFSLILLTEACHVIILTIIFIIEWLPASSMFFLHRLTQFLTDCAERIIVLKIVHTRVLNRYEWRLSGVPLLKVIAASSSLADTISSWSGWAYPYRSQRKPNLISFVK